MNYESDHNGEDLAELVKDYLNTRYNLERLKLIRSASDTMAALIAFVLVLIAGMLFLFFISYAVAGYLNEVTQTKNGGFFIVAAFYLAIIVLLVLVKKKSIQSPLENRFIRQFLK